MPKLLYAMMPLQKNVPAGREHWVLVCCPVCKVNLCWLDYELFPAAREAYAKNGDRLEVACTPCALKAHQEAQARGEA